ncbi:hypothetical protein [Crucivirus-480]|nr:hypothetical protein [Crucivirus-480]
MQLRGTPKALPGVPRHIGQGLASPRGPERTRSRVTHPSRRLVVHGWPPSSLENTRRNNVKPSWVCNSRRQLRAKPTASSPGHKLVATVGYSGIGRSRPGYTQQQRH